MQTFDVRLELPCAQKHAPPYLIIVDERSINTMRLAYVSHGVHVDPILIRQPLYVTV